MEQYFRSRGFGFFVVLFCLRFAFPLLRAELGDVHIVTFHPSIEPPVCCAVAQHEWMKGKGHL